MEEWTFEDDSRHILCLRSTAIHLLGVLGVGLLLHRKGRRRRPRGTIQVSQAPTKHSRPFNPELADGFFCNDRGNLPAMIDESSNRSVRRAAPDASVANDNSCLPRQGTPDAWEGLRRERDQARQQCAMLAEELERTRRDRERLRNELRRSHTRSTDARLVTGGSRHSAPLGSSLLPSTKDGEIDSDARFGEPSAVVSEGATGQVQPWLEHTTPVHSDRSSPSQGYEMGAAVESPRVSVKHSSIMSAGGMKLDPREIAAAMALRQRGFGGGLLNEASIDDVRRRIGISQRGSIASHRVPEPEDQISDVFSYYGD